MVITNIYKKLPQILVVLNGLLCIFTVGINFAWPSPFIPKLLSPEFPLEVTLEDISLFTTMGLIGSICGCITSTLFIDRIGRKYSLLLVAPIHIISFALLYLSTESLIFVHIARFLGGFLQPHLFFTLAIYVSEISEVEIRGLFVCLMTAVWNSGAVFINLVGAYYDIQTTSLISIAFPVTFLILFPLVPESPYYLLMKHNVKEARKSLMRLRYDKNVEAELNQMQQDVKRQMSEKGSLKDLFFIESNRRAFIIVTSLYFVELFAGHGPLTTFSQSFFSEATSLLSKEWATSIVMFFQVIFVIVSMFLVDIVGRKRLMLVSICGVAVSLIILSAYFFIKDFYWPAIDNFSWISIIVMILYNAFFNIGLSSVTPCIKAELFSFKVKGLGSFLTAVLHSVFSTSSTKLYQAISDYHSIAWPLSIFAIIQICGFVFCWKFLPETKKRTFEEIQQQLKLNYKN